MSELKVMLNEARHRFEADLGDSRAFIEFRWDGDVMVIEHTFVPESHRGQGIAGKIIQQTLDYIRYNKMPIRVTCPAVTAFMQRHPEYQDLLAD